jgi:hypothetical protein
MDQRVQALASAAPAMPQAENSARAASRIRSRDHPAGMVHRIIEDRTDVPLAIGRAAAA